MPRKPNYRFERMERERSKAAKKAARAQAKADKTEQRKTGTEGEDQDAGPDAAVDEQDE